MERRTSKKSRVLEWLGRRGIAFVTAAEWPALLAGTGISEADARRVLREAGIGAAQPFAGIRQRTLAELELSLLDMLLAYREAPDREAKRRCREAVIRAKDHARLAARRAADPALKQEMARWMLVWLENPEVFPAWAELRKQVLARETGPSTSG